MNYLFSDSLIRIKNAQLVKKSFAILYYSKIIVSFLNLMKDEGYIEDFEEFEERKGVKRIKVSLKYYNDHPVIEKIEVVSKPSQRVYKSYKDLQKVYGGLGMMIVSTSKGLLSDFDAVKMKLGGEILCNVL